MSIKTKKFNIPENMFWETALKGRNITAQGNALVLNTTTQIAPHFAFQKREEFERGKNINYFYSTELKNSSN